MSKKMSGRVAWLAFACVAVAPLCACPPSSDSSKNSGDPPTTCTSAGPQCTVAQGKLGVCVLRAEPCNGKPCFVCQSQH